MALDSALAANLLLAATIGTFILLTLIAFLMNEGKQMVVKPLKHRLKQTFGCNKDQVQLGEPVPGGPQSANPSV